MSANANHTPPMGTNSLLENLRKFRFAKKSLLGGDQSASSSEIAKSSESVKPDVQKQTGNTEDVADSKATAGNSNASTEEQASPQVKNQVNGTDSVEDNNPDSPIAPGKRKVKALSSDTEDDAPKLNGSRGGKKAKLDVDEEGRTSVENALKYVHDSYPDADILIIQDTLCQANWDVEKAKDMLKHIYSNGNASNQSITKKEKSGSNKTTKRKKRIENDSYEEDDDTDEEENNQGFKKNRVYDSDADSDEEISDELTDDKRKVLEFLSKADAFELQQMHSCSKKKAELIIDCRPFEGWRDMVEKLQNKGSLGGEMLNHALDLLQTREVAAALIKKCGKLASKMEAAVAAGLSNVQTQPAMMSKTLKLSDYQLIGLNWLLVMNSHQVNGILADEMGLGKTVQTIAFLSYLKENKMNSPGKPHLIVVPSSTLENWQNEFKRWCPSMEVAVYYGSQEDRKYQRIQWSKNGFGDIDVILTTYGMVNSCPEERKMFRTVKLHYAIFDEAHMLKNMYTLRYENLIKINAPNRILVTGTPLQNNLLELMSLLVFVMPKMFKGKEETLKALFSRGTKQPNNNKSDSVNALPEFERTQISQAKDIMKPFVLRRLKCDVLKGLPKKTEEIVKCSMTKDQEKKYKDLISMFSKQADKDLQDDDQSEPSESGIAMYMKLRRLANHPLLLRYHFKDDILKDMAKRLQTDVRYKDTVFEYILDDLSIMSDFELHSLCNEYKSCYSLRLSPSLMGESGKLKEMERLLPKLKEEGHRVLIFSQFVIVLDVLEEHFRNRGYKFLRLDGSTPVPERQNLIDDYNKNSSIFIFMLSTRAGGLGINLTSADTVIIHDVDPNPHNDKQAEDRCHRIGQTKPVTVLRLVSKSTIEENILSMAQEKLQLEREVSSNEENEQSEKKSVARLLKQALGLDKGSCSNSLKSPSKKST